MVGAKGEKGLKASRSKGEEKVKMNELKIYELYRKLIAGVWIGAADRTDERSERVD
jgi:hypothetical protein